MVVGFTNAARAETTDAAEAAGESAVVSELVVTGARGGARTVASSPAPIDVLTSQAVEKANKANCANCRAWLGALEHACERVNAAPFDIANAAAQARPRL